MSRWLPALPVIALLLSLSSRSEAATVRCDEGRDELAARAAERAWAQRDAFKRAILLEHSLAACPGYLVWLELGRAGMKLGDTALAIRAFEAARDFYAPDAAGLMGASELERRALADAWLAESHRAGGELAAASVAAEEARAGFAALGRDAPARLTRLQAGLDDDLSNADAAVLARSFELHHERATRGIGVRVLPEPEDVVAETAAISAGYETGSSIASAPTSAARAEPGSAPAPVVAAAPVEPAGEDTTGGGDAGITETRMNVPVLFDFDSDALAADGERTAAQLGEAVRALDLDERATLLILGHTDVQGDAAYNRALSERRAKTVLRRIRKVSGTRARLQASGRGESEPRYPGDAPDDHRRNRRVELVLRR